MTNTLPHAYRWVVIDDMDPSIRYDSPGWFTTNEAKETIGYFGSTVRLWGTNNPHNQSGDLSPKWDCLVDGASIGPTTAFAHAENNWIFCDWRGASGEHTLTMQAITLGQTFWVDKIEYIPFPGPSVEGPEAVSVPCMDESIRYGEGWGTTTEFARFTAQRGATLDFAFKGTKLSWWGFIPKEFPRAATRASYALDGGPSTPFALPSLSKKQTSTYNQMFFETSALPPGSHRLLVVYEGNQQTTPLTLTHLLIQGDNYTSPSTWSSLANSAFTVASSGSSSLTNIYGSSSNQASHAETRQGSAPEPSTSIPSQRTSNSDTNSGSAGAVTSMRTVRAIVGGVVGGLVLVIAATLFILLFRRRRARAKAKAAAYSQSHMHELPSPFVRPQQPVIKGRTQPLRKGQVVTAESLCDQKSGARCSSDESATTSRQAGEGREGGAVNT
ncbi:hypothetical protein BKA70DRAFT_1406863 [Coprinopsis sp. MPI-PUGE-AT-0042]|nr:hypothetical protein BKA70DRAFT_1406863 [Coprinopsis sp. MPI-PUGE-AT-0042]